MAKPKEKKSEQFTGKFDRLLSLVALIVGIAALGFSWQANRIANEANRISQEAQTPKISTQYLFSFRDYVDDYKFPCEAVTGGALWNIEFAAAFDITNLGGKAVSLVDIKQSNNGEIETFFPPVQASVRFDYFKTAEDFNNWFSVRSSPSSSWIEQSIDKFDFSGPPITIGAGETHRLLLWAGEWVSIEKGITPEELHKGLYDVNWSSDITFVFADGTTQQQSVRIIHPYKFEPQNVLLKPYEACPKP